MRNCPPQRSSLKRHLKVCTVVVFALLLCSVFAYLLPTTRAQNQPINTARKNKTANFVPGELLVRFRAGTDLARNKSKVSTPSSRLRESVLDVLKTEGFIRGYAAVEHSNGRKELEIEVDQKP